MLLLAAHPHVLSTDPPSGSVFRPSFRSWRFARSPTQPKSAPKNEGLSLKVSYTCGRTAIRGGSYDGPREAQRLGLGREDPRDLDRAGTDTSSLTSLSSLERCLTVGFSVWHLAWHFLARDLARSLSYGLLLEARRPDSLPIGSVLALKEWPEEVKGYGQDDGRVLLACDLAHRLKQPELQRCRALQTVSGLPEAL